MNLYANPKFTFIILINSFRLKIKVKDVEDEALFVLFDDEVEKFAPDTCNLMRNFF